MTNMTAVKISGYRGKWSLEETGFLNGEKVYFFEHNTYGEDACRVLCKINRVTNELVAIAESYEDICETIHNFEDYAI